MHTWLPTGRSASFELHGLMPSVDPWSVTQVALTALEFWQDVYVTTLAGLPADARKAALASHQVLLQHLCSALVLRARLEPDVAAAATADARDLPEHVRLVGDVCAVLKW